MVWLQVLLVVLVSTMVSGCELAGGIFKAGAWVGAIAVVLVIALAAIFVAKIRG